MIVQSTVRDCLYLNWALPLRLLPALPSPLRYDTLAGPDGDVVLASAVLFRHEHLHLTGSLLPSVSHPQCNLRLCVRDRDGSPAVYFVAMLAPWWIAPPARVLAGHPFAPATLDFDRPSVTADRDVWRFAVRRPGRLEVEIRRAAPPLPPPDLGGLPGLVDYCRRRPRGYLRTRLGLQAIETGQQRAAVWPVGASVARQDLLDRLLPLADGAVWPALHSAFLLPDLALVSELLPLAAVALARQAPVAG
jgi:hypothetical protein